MRPDGLGKKSGLRLRIKQAQLLDVRGSTHGLRQIWPGVIQFQLHAHGFGGNQNIRKNDDGVHAEQTKRLQGNFGGQVGSLTNFQKGPIGANSTIFGEVAARLAHHPHRHARKRFSPASAQEKVFAINCLWCGRSRGVYVCHVSFLCGLVRLWRE